MSRRTSFTNAWKTAGVLVIQRHHEVLEVAQGSVKRRLPLVSLANVDEMVGIMKVQLRDDTRLMEKRELSMSGRRYLFLFVMSLRPR